MTDQISATDNSVTATLDNPTGTQGSVNGTGAVGGQASEATPTSDLFKGIDPNQLPPQARVAYDSMLRDYRQKTGQLSETVKQETAKAAEAYRQKAEAYDQISAQEEFVKQWNEYVQKVQASGQTPQEGDPVLTQMRQQLQEMNQKIQLSELSQVTEAFAEAANEKGEALHPDFDDLNSISIGQVNNGNQLEDFSLLRACVELARGNSPQERLANGYKMANSVRESIFEEGRKAGMGRLQTKVLNASNPPSNTVGEVLSTTEKKPKNAREALEMARKGIRVSS